MSARISKSFAFRSAIHHEDSFMINLYDIDLSMEVNTEDIHKQKVAMERVRFLFDYCFENCVFVNCNDAKAIDGYTKANIKVCPLPEEPYDQIVAGVMLSKLNQVLEKHLFVNEVKIRSLISDDVVFYISYTDHLDSLEVNQAWWNDASPNICNIGKKQKRDKVVELKKQSLDWNTLGLSYEVDDGDEKETINGKIVFIPSVNNT